MNLCVRLCSLASGSALKWGSVVGAWILGLSSFLGAVSVSMNIDAVSEPGENSWLLHRLPCEAIGILKSLYLTVCCVARRDFNCLCQKGRNWARSQTDLDQNQISFPPEVSGIDTSLQPPENISLCLFSDSVVPSSGSVKLRLPGWAGAGFNKFGIILSKQGLEGVCSEEASW